MASVPSFARPPLIRFDEGSPAPDDYSWGKSVDRALLQQLRSTYNLEAVIRWAGNDLERVQRMSTWTRSRWRHNGSNEPSRPDPLTILTEAAAGRRFRCVEYSEVLAAALSSVGIPARVLGMQRSDIETATRGAGHVATEAWLADQQRWVYVDGQWDVIVHSGSQPLNAVELQAALAAEDPAFRAESFSGTSSRRFARWIAPYLFYFVVHPRSWSTGAPLGAKDLMLAPAGAPAPRVFQRRFAQPDYVLTRSVADFYAPPPVLANA